MSQSRERNKYMRTCGAQLNQRSSSYPGQKVLWSWWLAVWFAFVIVVILAATGAPAFGRQATAPPAAQTNSIASVTCVIGLEDIKTDAKGTLSLLPTGLEFATEKKKTGIATASITDIFVGNQSRQDVSGAGGTVIKMGIPYGGGRLVSLFSHKVEVLTVEYEDSNGGFHGAIFVLPQGQATSFKNQLVAQGAKVSTHVESSTVEEQKP